MNAQVTLTRRQFLRGATGAAVGWSVVNVKHALAADPASNPTPSWVDKPMRWAQLTSW
ncbi:MAG TPA: twin-arginine translocation signal domain-containing protein [Candidatus Limnocylindria bacterium]|nr:twin-arginine translocation signal domain-containing protein [Candidatus Limnocylindria bacterium]